jgi:hypothetical protein
MIPSNASSSAFAENVHRIENILGALSMQYFVAKKFDKRRVIAHRYDILNSLNDDEKTLAL